MFSFIRKNKRNKTPAARIYITGDKHRDFRALIRFCKKNRTTPADTIIILGDACFNYFGDARDDQLKQKLTNTKVTLFCIRCV